MGKRSSEQILDELLIIRCQSGESGALTELIKRWNKRLMRYIWRLTDGHADSADIAQDVWISAIKKVRRLRDPACFPQWIYRIATARCADWTRRQSRERKLRGAVGDQNETVSSIQTGTDEPPRMAALRIAMKSLPADQQLLMALFYVDELSVGAIAESLDIPVGTVKSRLFALRESLRKTIERSDQ